MLTASRKKIVWGNLAFFAGTFLAAAIGCPLYAAARGVGPAEWGLFLFFAAATGMSVTAGYHRLFSHAAYRANPLVRFLFLFFGAAAFEQSALDWSSQHRDHHRYVDTDLDPYSIRKGFFYAHLGWLVFWEHPVHHENALDLKRDPLVMHQHRHYAAWAVAAGVLAPLAVGALTGRLLGAFLFAVCLRLALVHHATFCINSVCHVFGDRTYDAASSARDHWLVAFLTNGEGYHNFHHRFPLDYRNGVRWYQWDPTKWFVAALAFLGLADGLRRTPERIIREARISAGNARRAAFAWAGVAGEGI